MKSKTNGKQGKCRIAHICDIARDNTLFRKVFYTSQFGQLVLMSIPPGVEIGETRHPQSDLFLFILEGEGEITRKSKSHVARKGDAMVVPAGTRHNLKNSGEDDLKLIAIFTSPEYPKDAVCKTQDDAHAAAWKALAYAWEQ